MQAVKNVQYKNSPQFTSKFSRIQKRQLMEKAQEAANFRLKSTGKKLSETSLSLAAISSFGGTAMALAKGIDDVVGIMATCGTILRHVCISDHKDAIRNAAGISKRLKTAGFSKEERQIIAHKVMESDGNILYSNLFRLAHPKRMNEIADGTVTKSGYLHISFRDIKNYLNKKIKIYPSEQFYGKH